ncbi:glycosyltransferase family 2 protein, partial [Brevibacterium casei]|uniref:glycosyltransferase family 2 protein n=1 Tax=Brevibacterium casei TaxID=33889 RepID=UPI0011A58ED1
MQRKDLLRTATDKGRRLARRLPDPVRRRVNGTLESNLLKQVIRVAVGAQRRETGPLVTIVVPVYNVAQYLPEFLDSVVGQTYKNLEILVVDDGSPDESASIARRWGRWDRRIRVISKQNGGLGDARNAGLRSARGEYITFADSDDVLAPNGIRAMVETIEKSGSDFVVGTMVRAQGGKTWLPQWTRRAHSTNRIGITVDEFPEILLDVFACNKIWNTEFFRTSVGGFPVGVAYEDQEPSVKSYLNAAKFDVIKDHVYYWRIRDDGSSITQQKAKISDLRDRIKVSLAVAGPMTSSNLEAVRRGWYRKIFGTDLIQYIEQVPRTGPEYFEELCDGYQAIITLCEEDFWRDVATYPKLAAWCVLNRDYESLMEVIAGNIERGRGYRLSRRDGVLSARPMYLDALVNQPDDAVLEIRDEYLDLVAKATNIEWINETEVIIGGHAFVRSAFERAEPTAISLALINSVTGDRMEIPTTQMSDTGLNAIAQTEARDCTNSAFEARIDVSELTFNLDADASADQGEAWKVAVTVEFGDVRREEVIRDIADDGGAAVLGHSGMSAAGRVVSLSHDQQEGLRFRLARPKTTVRDLSLQGRTLSVSVKSLVDSEVAKLELRSKVGRTEIQAASTRIDSEGFAHFTVELPRRLSTVKKTKRSRWEVHVRLADGTRRMVHGGRSTVVEA